MSNLQTLDMYFNFKKTGMPDEQARAITNALNSMYKQVISEINLNCPIDIYASKTFQNLKLALESLSK